MDYYEVLGVRRNATLAEIRRAYQKRARQLHPDLNPGDPVAEDRFRVVSLAFKILSDPQQRTDYDRGGVATEAPGKPQEVGFEGFDFTAEVSVGRVGFREIFGGVMGGAAAAARAERTPGEDLEQSTAVSFEEAFRGARRRVQLVRQDRCPLCGGSGEVAIGPVSCPTCGGTGQVRASRGHMIFSRTCPDCGGAGRLRQRGCGRCDGEGRVMQSEWLEVEIPPGVADGARVRVPGCGNAGRRGGPPGDFVLVVQVDSHPFYRREGEDLHCTVPVTVAEAAVGAHIDVPTLDGPMVIEIPAGTQAGQRFRLRKRGMPRLGARGRGDLYVEIAVRIPAVTGDRGRELLREFAELHPEDPRRELGPRQGGR
jgi:molecular chaperone DnaJ